MRKIIAFVLAAALLCLCGCGKDADAPADTASGGAGAEALDAEGGGMELRAELLELPEGMAYASAQCRGGDTLWLGGVGENGAVIASVSLSGGEGGGALELTEECEFVYAMCYAEGGVTALAGSRPERYTDAKGQTERNENADGRLWLLRYGAESLISQTELEERYFHPDSETPEVFKSMLELNGDLYIQCQDFIARIGPDGGELARFELDEYSRDQNYYISSMVFFGGELLASEIGFGGDDSRLLRLNAETLEQLGASEFPEHRITGLGLAGDGAPLACTRDGLLSLGKDLLPGEYVRLWKELFISGGYTWVGELEDGYLFYEPYQEKVYAARWREYTPRTTVIVAADNPYSDILSLVNAFNLSQGEYVAKVEYYDTYDEAEQKQLQAEIGAGYWPDVFAFSHPETLAEMRTDTMLVDLYERLDADAELSREDLVPSLLAAMEERGALYWLPHSFQMLTMLGPAALIPRAGMSYGELSAIAADNGLTAVDPYISREQLLTWCCPMAIERYVDYEAGTCSFDSEGFIGLLELCAAQHADSDASVFNLPRENYLLFYEWLQSFERLSVLPEIFGDFRFAGFPDGLGNGSLFDVQLRLGITAGAAEKDGAWEFIKFACGETGQGARVNGFPANAASLERELNSVISDGSGGLMGSGYPFTEADAQKFRELVNGAVMVSGADTVLEQMITEGAAAYFAGEKSAREAAELIQAKAGLYMAERA
ncbi:MAG: hypothetical protein NC319_06525 [Butyricicoccus sp.]|nr:hypothetical protein [Butyricicoccus sp.]